MNRLRYFGAPLAVVALTLACQAQAAPPLLTASPTPGSATAAPVSTVAPSPTTMPAHTPKPLPEHVAAQWSVANPSFIAFGFGSVWVADHSGHSITRIDPVSNQVAATIRGTGSNPEDALEAGGALWVTGQNDDTTLIDPATNTITRTVPGDLLFMDYGFGSVWATTRDRHLDRFDPATAEMTASISLGSGESGCMNDVMATATAIWVNSCDTGELMKVDPVSNSVASTTSWATLIADVTGQPTLQPGKGTDSIWLDVGGPQIPSGLLQVSPATGRGIGFVALSPDQLGDGFIAVTDTAIWLAGSAQLSRFDVATSQVDVSYPTAAGRQKVGVNFGSVWLRNYEHFTIQRLDVKL